MKQAVVVVVLVFAVVSSSVYANFGLPFEIPGLREAVTKAIGNGTAPLLAVNASAAEILAKEKNETLGGIQEMLKYTVKPLDKMFATFKSYVNSDSAQFLEVSLYLVEYMPYQGYVTAVYFGAITSPVNDAISKANADLRQSIFDGYQNYSLYIALSQMKTAVNNALHSDPPATSADVSKYVTPDLVTKVAKATAVVVTKIEILAKAVQMAVWELFPPSINPAINTALPTIVPQLASFNDSADWTRTVVTLFGNYVTSRANSTFNPVTSSPSSWNNGNIDNLTTYLANFTSLVQNNFTRQSFDAGIDQLKASVTASFTDRVSQLRPLINKAYTVIANTAAGSASSNKAKDCVSRYNLTSLQTSAASTAQRLSECIQLEADTLFVLKVHAKGALEKAKHHATKLMEHLRLCGDQNGTCAKELFASLADQYQRTVVTTLTLISNYTTSGLMDIASRITDCMTAISAETMAEAQTIYANFSSCSGLGRGYSMAASGALAE